MLKYITKADSTPQGKPRVYFCCHPQEHSLFLKPISETLLAKQNCTLWYLENPNGERNLDFWEDLSQMQLFVMPVTYQLLSTDNPAMDEFYFAVQKHIPVLPLMQESGLEALFNRKCGDLQFLDPNLHDDTAIRFDEKLDKYLSGVLVGDELAKQVRSAFDAYVFLSYRKKDRRYAQELMRLIHQNEFCRDIAIWYDEYLTPGENFNHSIENALKKCDLFALAVTPNILEKVPDQHGVLQENYVAAHEYPMALRSGKPILPIQMQKTNPEALAAKYQSLPLCINGQDRAALARALADHLRSMALRKPSQDPHHTYLIGLAYLQGIDVEVDHARALTLITSAAKHGILEAMSQLTLMYRTGHAVARNYQTALTWQEKKTTLLEKQYRKSPTDEILDSLFWSLIGCGDSHNELTNTRQAIKYFETALKYAESHNPPQPYLQAIALQRIAAVYETQGDWEAARTLLRKSMELQESLAGDTTDAEGWRYLAISYEQWGDLCQKNGDYGTARTFFESSLKIFEVLLKELGSSDCLQDLGVICNRIGTVCRLDGDYPAAQSFFQRSLEIREKLAAENSSDLNRANLATCYDKMGELYQDQEEPDTAAAYYNKSKNIRTALAKETGLAIYRRDLMISYLRLGSLDTSDRCKNDCEQALSMAQALAAETGSAQAHIDVINALDQLGKIWEEEDLSVARTYYERVLEVHTTLNAISNIPLLQRSLAKSLGNLGRVCKYQGDSEAAKTHLTQSIEIGETIAKKDFSNGLSRELASTHLLLGSLLAAENDMDAAIEHYERSMVLGMAEVQNTGSVEARQFACVVCLVLGQTYSTVDNLPLAKKMLSCSAGIANEVAEETEDYSDWSTAATCYLELANLLCKTGDRDNAISYYQLSLNIRSSLEESDPSAEAKRQVLEVHRKLAELHIASGDVLATEACYMQSVPLAHTLCQETGDLDDMESLAMDYSNLAYTRKQQGDMEQATALYRKCLQIRYAVAEESHAAHAWDMVGRTLLKIVLVDQENADNYLQQAAQIYHALTQAYPYDPQYQQFMTMLEEYL